MLITATAVPANCQRLGFGHYDGGGYPAPFLTQVKSLGMGFYSHAALHTDGTVTRWAEGDTFITPGAKVVGVAQAVAASWRCTVTSEKNIACFEPVFEPTGGLTGAQSLVSGNAFSCAVMGDRTVKCWGQNSFGQPGNNSTNESNSPVEVVGVSGVEALSAWYNFACALLTDHTVKCWGQNGSGSLGNNSDAGFATVAVQVSGLTGVRAVSAGYHHACALLMNGHVRCWGQGDNGALGNGGTTDSLVPVDVNNVSNAVLLSAGLNDTCVITAQGAQQCWP